MKRIFLVLIRGYQRFISPLFPACVPVLSELFGIYLSGNRKIRGLAWWMAGHSQDQPVPSLE